MLPLDPRRLAFLQALLVMLEGKVMLSSLQTENGVSAGTFGGRVLSVV